MSKGLVSMGSLTGPLAGSIAGDVRSLFVRTTADLERACGWREIPPVPPAISHLTSSTIAELRAGDDATASHVLRAWNESAAARSSAIVDNINRMRGLLCCLRYWRQVQRADPDDIEACKNVLAVWSFARDHWGIQQPPADSRLWESYCESHVLAMRDRKERQACR